MKEKLEIIKDLTHLDLYIVKKSDKAKVVPLLAKSFSEDPCFLYIMGKNGFNYKHAEDIFSTTFDLALEKGIGFAPTEQIEGFLAIIPPSQISTSSYLSHGLLSLPFKLPPGVLWRLLQYSNHQEKIEKNYIPEPHWYYYQLAVAEHLQGKGYGSLLMEKTIKVLRKYNQKVFLETHPHKNVKFYKKFGFKVVSESLLPHSSKKHYAMVHY